MEADSTIQRKLTEDTVSQGAAGTNRSVSKTERLRPCEVCASESSGYHFGVISCEACKSFFRRTMKLKLEYTCIPSEAGECNLRQVKGARPPCPACRFKKCISLGMSLDAAKKGRYSHARRVETVRATTRYWEQKQTVTENTKQQDSDLEMMSVSHGQDHHSKPHTSTDTKGVLEEKSTQAEAEQQLPQVGDKFSGSNLESTNNRSVPDPISIPLSMATDLRQSVAEQFQSMTCQTETKAASQSHEAGEVETSAGTLCIDHNKPVDINQTHDTDTYCSPSTDIAHFLKLGTQTAATGSGKFAEIVADAYDCQNFLPKGFMAKVPLAIHKYLVEQHCKKKKHPVQEPITKEHHRRVFLQTGIDLDGRMEVFRDFINDSEVMVKKMTAFSMKIPGFKTLCADDRISIIKKAKLEAIIIILYPVHYPDEGVCILPSLRVLSKDLLKKFYESEMIDTIFKLTKSLQDLYFNERENALFATLILVNPAYCETENGSATCRSLQQYVAQCLGQNLASRVAEDKLESMLQIITQVVDDIATLSRQFDKEAEALALHMVPGVSGLMAEMFNKDADVNSE